MTDKLKFVDCRGQKKINPITEAEYDFVSEKDLKEIARLVAGDVRRILKRVEKPK